MELARQIKDANFLSNALGFLARTEVLLGNPAQALSLAEQAISLAQQGQQPTQMATALHAYGLALEAGGRKNEALQALRQAMAQEPEERMAQRMGLEVDRIGADREGARKRYNWFMEQEMPGMAQAALRYFPELNAAINEAPVSPGAGSSLFLKVLGPVGIEESGQALSVRAKKRLEVLCYLLEARIAGRAEVDILELVDVFYPELPEDRAKLTLRQLIYLIRANLGEGSIQNTPGGYALGAIGSDIEDFLKTGDASLWRGVYLKGLSDGWNANVRDGLLLALRSKVEAILAAEPVEAARLGQIWLEMEPYDLDALRLTIQALKNQGNIKTAERVYKQGQERLSEVGESLPKGLEEFLGIAATA